MIPPSSSAVLRRRPVLMPARGNTAMQPTCRSRPAAAPANIAAKAHPHPVAGPLLPSVGRQRAPAQKSTNPISTKCTPRSPCPTAPAASGRVNPRPIPAAAKSSSPPTRASPARSSGRRHAPAAARRDIGAGGRRGRTNLARHSGSRVAAVRNPYSRSWLWIPGSRFARPGMTRPASARPYSLKVVIPVRPIIRSRLQAAGFETCVRSRTGRDRCGQAFRSARRRHGRHDVHA